MILTLALAATLASGGERPSEWQPLTRGFAHIAAPLPDDLSASRFGTRVFVVRFRGSALEISRQGAHPVVPFQPVVETATMGNYGSQPSQALHVGETWFLAYYHGEFGGALWQFNADGSVGRRLLTAPTDDLIRYGDEVLAATGSAAPFFFKPLRIYRFALENGTWAKVGHVDFPNNLFGLTDIGGHLFAFEQNDRNQVQLVRIDLSGNVAPLWDALHDLSPVSIAMARNGDMAIGARGYVIWLRHRGNGFVADWYAPHDCARYTASANGIAARCIGAAGSKPYVHTVAESPSNIIASRDGMWMLTSPVGGLLHFANGRWGPTMLPEPNTYYWGVDVVGGTPFLGAAGELWALRAGHWAQVGPRVECSSHFSIKANTAWCLLSQPKNSRVVGIRLDGRTVTAVVSGAQPQFVAAGMAGDAWFTMPTLSSIGHVAADGAVSDIPLRSPAAWISDTGDDIWFSETDKRHFGFIDSQSRVHELSRNVAYGVANVVNVYGGGDGAWLLESIPNVGESLTFLHDDVSEQALRVVQHVKAFVVTRRGTLFALSDRWPTVMRLSRSGELSRYRLPCPDPYLRLLPAPNDGLWVWSKDPRCSALIANGAIRTQGLPSVETVEYK